MKKVLPSVIVLAALLLTGCTIVVEPNPPVVARTVVRTVAPAPVVVVYEPDVYVNGYYVGYYRHGYGYWTGYGWDVNFYVYGHAGYGRYYRGAPSWAYQHYRRGPHHHHRHDNRRYEPPRRDHNNDRRGRGHDHRDRPRR